MKTILFFIFSALKMILDISAYLLGMYLFVWPTADIFSWIFRGEPFIDIFYYLKVFIIGAVFLTAVNAIVLKVIDMLDD